MRSWLVSKVHVYYLTVAFFVGIILGIVGCIFTEESKFSNHFFLILAGLLLVASFIRFRKMIIISMLFAGIFLGLWRGSTVELGNESYGQYINQTISLSGKIVDDVTYSATGEQRFKLDEITISDKKLPGEVWVSASGDNDMRRSDTIAATGYMSEGFGSFRQVL